MKVLLLELLELADPDNLLLMSGQCFTHSELVLILIGDVYDFPIFDVSLVLLL